MDGRQILEAKKRQIEGNLASLYEDVTTALDKAIKCMVKLEPAVCEALIRHDAALNGKRRLLEQDCLVAIASQQPVASDLRDLIADMRIASELERMGDYASDIAAVVLQMDGAAIEADWLLQIQRMAGVCQAMLHDAMRAHRGGDAELARRVGARDDELDAELARAVAMLMAVMRQDSARAENASRALWIAHNLERFGDRATNIAEQVVFRVEGDIVELD